MTPEYLRAIKNAGYERLAADDVVQLKIHGVPESFLKAAKDNGYDFSPRDLVQLRQHGVDGAYLRRVKDAGFTNLRAGQIARLKQHGVD